MNQFRAIGKKIVRIDGESKATGKLKYMADHNFTGLLYGKILYPPFFRAKINKIDYSEALECEDIITVVTAEDIPGSRFHGLIYKDHPVICDSRVNYRGDVVAVVVARTEEAAIKARDLIRVDYEELPCIRTVEEALSPDGPAIHEGGNIAGHYEYKSCDNIEGIFEKAPFVFEETFETGYQEHSCLETEGGIAVPTDDGGIVIWYGCQNGHRVRRDLSAILDLPPEKIEVRSHPLGGGFGGKDDLLLQGILGVCALKCKKPVYINLTREESFFMGPKKMPFRIELKIAVDREGKFLANRVRMTCKAGPYACYTPAILDYALQLSCGMYYFPVIDVSGDVVYTNGFLSSALRGFGNNQAGFAIESMVDIIAEKLKINKLELRQKNMVRKGGMHCFGNSCSTDYPSVALFDELKRSRLLNNAEEFKSKADKPWLKRGVGIATVHQGVGLGNHLPDTSTCEAELLENGRLRVSFGNEDMGQGSITTLLIIASEAMHMPLEMIEHVNGTTGKSPDSGPMTASRVTYISGKAIVSCIGKLQEEIARALGCEAQQLIYTDNGINKRSWQEIAGTLSESQRKKTHTQVFENEARNIGLGLSLFFSNAAQVTGVEINTLTGETKVLESEIITACGTVINRLGYEGQSEGGVVMSQGYALYEDFREGIRNYQTYLIPTMADCPDIKVVPIEDPEEAGPFGAKGMAEIVNVPGTPAIINAINDAVNIRFREIPVKPEKLLMELRKRDAPF